MSSLMEKLAAKKAAAAMQQETKKEEALTPSAASTVVETVAKEPVVHEQKVESKEVQAAPEKPLTFAEKMALKLAHKNVSTAISPAPLPTPEKKEEPAPAIVAEIATISPIKEMIVAAVEAEDKVDTSALSESDAQAYADIKAKINMLADMSQDELRGAMTELKKALLQNPQACYLILPQDIGQMVIALRTMKNEAVVEATKTPKEKKAKTSKALTADEIAAAFDSL